MKGKLVFAELVGKDLTSSSTQYRRRLVVYRFFESVHNDLKKKNIEKLL
jgi:hypothetical protein